MAIMYAVHCLSRSFYCSCSSAAAIMFDIQLQAGTGVNISVLFVFAHNCCNHAAWLECKNAGIINNLQSQFDFHGINALGSRALGV